MIREFKMPDVGEGLTEAEILTWYVRPGDTVTDGQVVCEIETAKAAVELPVPYAGVVHALHHPEGALVDVGAPVIAVEVAQEHRPAERVPVLVGYGVAESPTGRRARKGPAPAAGATGGTGGAGGAGSGAAVRPLAKPPVRKLAKDLGVDLALVIPSAPDGIIRREDVHAASVPLSEPAAAPTALAPATAAAPPPAATDGARETRVPVKGVRRATAAAMTGSAFTAPHVTLFVTVDVTRTMKLVEELRREESMRGLRISPLLPVARALLTAVARNPGINAAWDESAQEIVHKHYVNLGIAAATPRGLVVPNIKDAHTKSLRSLAEELGRLVTTAREGRTSPEAMRDGTITLTNIGVFGVDTGTPILNPGESAILAVGAIAPRPWVHKGRVRPRQVTTLALSFDHRLVDGELGSKVLADVAAILERPGRLISWG